MQQTPTSLRCLLGSLKICPAFMFLLLLASAGKSSAQCQLTCNNSIQASLDENCENEITWDALLEGTPPMSCIDDLEIGITYSNGVPVPTSPVVTVGQLNLLLKGTVTHVPSGQSCQTLILVEDKLKPVIICEDTLLSCFHDLSPDVIGYPEAWDNCTNEVELSFFDQTNTFNCTLTDTVSIVGRQWTATDTSGNTATCVQTIYVERPHLDSIQFPANLDNISAPPLYCNSAILDIYNTGMPMYDSLFIDSICSFFIEYEDVEVPICEGSFTVFRSWTVYDGCALDKREEEQTINVMDTLPPDISCPVDITVSVENNSCQTPVSLPTPVMYDSCSSTISVTLEGSFGLVAGTYIPSLEVGVYETTCYAADGCGNVSTCVFNISVIDNVPPVAVGVGSPVVSLLPQGTTYLPAASFNAGSWDNCGPVSFLVRRKDAAHCLGDDETPFGVEVPFYCCDAGKMVQIELKVSDIQGNSSTVLTNVSVNDNLEPAISCPSTVTLDCHEDYQNTSITGEPAASDNCGGYTVVYVDDIVLDACGLGSIARTWSITDVSGYGASCVQSIYLENLTPFNINKTNSSDPNDDVVWPGNYISTTCGDGLLPAELPDGFGYPEIIDDGFCQMIAVSYSDTWLSQPNNACIEILRNWTIIDWCQFNQTTFEGSWHYGQVIRIQNSDPPTILSTCNFEEFCGNGADCLSGQVSMGIAAEDDCNDASELKYVYRIDFHDDGSDDLTGSGHHVDADVPIGTHRIFLEVEDGCYNTAYCEYLFGVVDCKKPTPVCKDVVVEIMDGATPSIQVLPQSFNEGSYDNCTASDALLFSFSANVADTLQVFDCNNIGVNEVELWVTDEEGNQDFCLIEIEVQDNMNVCSTVTTVSGNIASPSGDDVSLVQVMLNDLSTADSMVTGLDGNYSFDGVLEGGDYTVTPIKDIFPLNGVTTFDVVLITKHILGVVALDSPYKIIAADANGSGAVTTLDIVLIRKLILNISNGFPNNRSWRFVPKDYQFGNPANPFEEDFPEVISINNLTADFLANFIAIKIGDVNDSADVTE